MKQTTTQQSDCLFFLPNVRVVCVCVCLVEFVSRYSLFFVLFSVLRVSCLYHSTIQYQWRFLIEMIF